MPPQLPDLSVDLVYVLTQYLCDMGMYQTPLLFVPWFLFIGKMEKESALWWASAVHFKCRPSTWDFHLESLSPFWGMWSSQWNLGCCSVRSVKGRKLTTVTRKKYRIHGILLRAQVHPCCLGALQRLRYVWRGEKCGDGTRMQEMLHIWAVNKGTS